jgi:hypothetical protein
MRKECEEPLKPGQPALIVTYGNTTRKHRALDQDVLVLGRNPCCDIALVSPEVAPVHCIILRTGQGWRVRDCSGGRHATRVNGRAIHEDPLHDSDVLQIGTFSFELRLPSSCPTPVPGATPVVDERLTQRMRYLQRSRQKLARLALKWRQRARRSHPLPPTLAELERQAESLRALQRDYEALVTEYEGRLSELEKVEREVCDARARLESESTERQTRLEKAEHAMARQQAEAESLIKVRWEECQQRCRQAEQAHARLVQVTPGRENQVVAVSHELARQLDRRSQELNYFARYLRRCRQRLRDQVKPVPLVVAPSQLLQPDAQRAQRDADVQRWQQQYQAVQAELAALEARSQQRQTELAAERDKARTEADAAASRIQELQSISESLRREIQDRESVLDKLRRQLDQQTAPVNLEHSGSYERELNAFRLELEQDRRDVNDQLYQLQARQTEMEAAAREAEVNMSRERAMIARERAELTRLREEIRQAKDRSTREGGVRERLANLHRLKQEIVKPTSASAPSDLRKQ